MRALWANWRYVFFFKQPLSRRLAVFCVFLVVLGYPLFSAENKAERGSGTVSDENSVKPGDLERASPAHMPLPKNLPSPSTFVPTRQWEAPHLSMWPGILYAGEQRNVVLEFELPEQFHSFAGSGKVGKQWISLLRTLPEEQIERTAALIALPQQQGFQRAQVTVGRKVA